MGTLGKAEKAVNTPKKLPARGGGYTPPLQPGDFGYTKVNTLFGGTNLDMAGAGKPAQESGPPLSRFTKVFFQPKGDKQGTQPGDFGYGDIMKGKKYGGTTKDLTGMGKPATDYSTRPGRRQEWSLSFRQSILERYIGSVARAARVICQERCI